MFAAFRRLTKSTVGTVVTVLFVLAILASFAMADISSVGSGTIGLSQGTIAEAGDEPITEREMTSMMQRRLTQVRQENPEADYAAIAADFDPVLAALIQERAVEAFARTHGLTLSRRLVDAEIAKLPATRGLDGRFSEQAYATFLQQQRLTDAELRRILGSSMIQQLLLAPASANARIPVGVATPYASMLLEARDAEAATIPVSAFAAAIPEPSAADIQRFYAANRARYTVPEQRVLNIARIGPEQVAKVAASDQEIEAYYKANQATYGGRAIRVISQAVLPTKAQADGIAGQARTGKGLGTQAVSVGPQTREEFARLAGAQVAAAAFGAQQGAVVGPIQSDLGWHVVKVDAIRNEAGRPLASVRGEIAARLTADKRKNALADLVAKVEDGISDGSSFAEAIRAAGLTAARTPPLTAGGIARGQPEFKLPAELAPALSAGFEISPDDDPVVETLPGEAGYALVGVDQVIASAPAPLASIRDQVASDWKASQARDRARAAATAIAAKVARGMSMAAAVADAGTTLPPPRKLNVRRMELAQMGGNVPPALAMMFSLAQGRSRMVADPQGRGFIIVRVAKITPGNARLQPTLISQTQNEFQQTASGEYAEQLTKAIEKDVGVKRNEQAIAAARKRITGSGI